MIALLRDQRLPDSSDMDDEWRVIKPQLLWANKNTSPQKSELQGTRKTAMYFPRV